MELLLLHGIEGLSGTERAQDEFFHLFEALIRRGGRILLAADRAPSRIEGVDERIRSRFEGGLVLDLAEAPTVASEALPPPAVGPAPDPAASPVASPAPVADAVTPEPPATDSIDDLAALRELAGVPTRGGPSRETPEEEDLVVVARPATAPGEWGSGWFPSAEKAVWEWPELEVRLVDEEE